MKKGFTIIEVALVLAIGGLIFLMVFVALPGLRASQRDTSRRSDITKVVDKIKEFQTNNRGGIPSGIDTFVEYDESASDSSWAGFYRDYLGKNFLDPSGEAYKLNVVSCGAAKIDKECSDESNINDEFFPNGYTINVVLQATCKGEEAIQTANPRKIAVIYKLEGAGTFCSNT